MDIQVKETSTLGREITVVIPKATVEEQFEARCVEVAQSMKLDGFRPGKVPVKVAKERHGDQIFHEMEHQLIQMGLSEAMKKHELTMAGSPKIDHDHKHEVADFKFTANIEIFPKVELKGLDKIKLTKDTAKADKKLLEKSFEELQTRMQTFKEVDAAAKTGDRVTVTGQGYTVDGKKEEAFEGGNLQEFPIVLGSNSLIPGFEEQLEGVKAGDKKDVKMPFPKEYHAKELAGKDAVFKLEINKIEASEKPEFDDEFAKTLGQDSADALKKMIEGSLNKDIESAAQQRLKRFLFDHLDAKNKFDLPQNMVERELGGLVQSQMNQLARQGITPEQAGTSLEDMKKEFGEIAERRVKLGLLLAEIAKEQKMEISENELRTAILDQVEAAGPQAEQARAYFADPNNRQQLIGPLLEEKVTAWLLENATIEEKEIDAEELLKEFQ
ncbi:MAG: trigger factor [Alphaproteobacteria bacterium]|nr:trigger factor [Alphaproteobacteria bacterium]MDD9919052.1 trigger factor [Alphaproteobacteria bacterium]